MKTNNNYSPKKPASRENNSWNKCNACGRFISFFDLENGHATRKIETPDSEFSCESWETLCRDHQF